MLLSNFKLCLMLGWRLVGRLAAWEDGTLVSGHHVLDVNEGIGTATELQQFQSVLDDVANALAAIRIDTLAQIYIDVFVEVANGQQLAIEWYQSLSHTRS